MKTIEHIQLKDQISNVSGFIRAGHAALKVEGACIVETSQKRRKLMDRPFKLDYLDRVVTPQEFANITNSRVSMAGMIYRPKRYAAPTKKQVHSFYEKVIPSKSVC